jgi:hypothetical protein
MAGPALSPTRWLTRAASAAGLLLVLVLAFVSFVPPFPPGQKAHWPEIPAVPASENAWRAYAAGLADLAREPIPQWLLMATEAAHLRDDQTAYLDRHAAAVRALHEGASRPRAQYFTEPTTATTPMPWMRSTRALAQLGSAQGHRLRLERTLESAWPLELAAYRFGTDVAEPDTGAVTLAVALGCRRTAASSLFQALTASELRPDSYAAIARAVAREDARMPSPLQMAQAESNVMGRSVEAYYLTDRLPGAPRQPEPIPGLRADAFRMRVLDRFFRLRDAELEMLRPALENWQFETLLEHDAARRRRPVPGILRWPFFVERTAAGMLQRTVSPIGPITRVLYLDRANGAALVALAALRAHASAHGQWPDDLGVATGALGLPVPLDPLTGGPIRYRLEAGVPLVWLRGFDRSDDGGQRAYGDKRLFSTLPGTDLVYRMGERPSLLRADP